MSADVRFRLRIRRAGEIVIGPGKIELLEAIDSAGSIAAAARAKHVVPPRLAPDR